MDCAARYSRFPEARDVPPERGAEWVLSLIHISQDFTVASPLVLQVDTRPVWQGLLQLKRRNGIVSMGLA